MSRAKFESYAIAAQEDRCGPRTRIAVPAMLRVSRGRPFHTTVHDLSISGFSASAVSRMHPGQICWLTLPGLESLQAEVVWWEGHLTGCAFQNLLHPIIHEYILSHHGKIIPAADQD